MCGIAGAIGWIDQSIVNAVDEMTAAQSHRGPDDCGQWQSTDCGMGACFGFRRLAILDLSPSGHQPMIDEARGNVIIFNGEIYNFNELRRELQDLGERFHSTGDTEVLLKGYGRWGSDVLKRLRGMFAFAIWDAQRRAVFMARDRLGIKPLYYTIVTRNGRDVLLLSSELRALIASGLCDRRMNAAALSTYIWNGFVFSPETIIDGVHMLSAGHFAVIDPNRPAVHPQRYWELPRASPQRDGFERLEHALTTAAQQHLLSDAPLGVFVSGGVDSSAVTALAARHGGANIRTFNVSFEESEFDESRYARRVAEQLGTQHAEIRLTQQEFRDHLHEALASIDQPTFDAINTYFVSRAAREAGMTVALAGTGGDELFGGYKSFRDNPRAARICRAIAVLPRSIRSAAARSCLGLLQRRDDEMPSQTRWGKLADLLDTGGRGLEVHQISYSLFTREFMNQLLRDGVHPDVVAGLPRSRAEELLTIAYGHLDLHAMSLLELTCYVGERLLRDTDCTSMAVSLEVRVPLLDHEVIEAAAALDWRQRFLPLGSKPPLRSIALRDLDQSIFNRPKSGFVLPIERWCRNQLQEELNAVFSNRECLEAIGINPDAALRLWRAFERGSPGVYWSRVWSLFVLATWCRMHRVRL